MSKIRVVKKSTIFILFLRCAVVPHTYRTCPTGRHLLALIIDTSNFELVWFELDDGTYQIE